MRATFYVGVIAIKVYLTPPQPSRGLDRIAHALRRYAPPWVEVCEFPRNVDLTVLWAIGRCDHLTKQSMEIEARGKDYAVIQVCLRSTMKPDTQSWWHLWRWAKCVWSYYDLPRAIDDDGGDGDVLRRLGNFYHAPLGADAGVFARNSQMERGFFTIATSGLSRLSESVRECYQAVKAVDGQMFHLGPVVIRDNRVTYSGGVDDRMLATYYSGCSFVSGLRRKEGFELPAVEGLLCKARPIVFDTLDYRWNYQDFAEYIHEGTRQEVIDQLVELFKRGARPVTDEERQRAVERFNWETIIGGFYERLR